MAWIWNILGRFKKKTTNYWLGLFPRHVCLQRKPDSKFGYLLHFHSHSNRDYLFSIIWLEFCVFIRTPPPTRSGPPVSTKSVLIFQFWQFDSSAFGIFRKGWGPISTSSLPLMIKEYSVMKYCFNTPWCA